MAALAHKIRLDPTESQVAYFKKASGVARFAYNWALGCRKAAYDSGEKIRGFALIKHLNSIKKTEFPWMLEVGKTAPQYAIHDVEAAFKNFFKNRKHFGYPKFKKKGHCKDSFRIDDGSEITIKLGRVRVPRLGLVKMFESLRFKGKIVKATVVREAHHWFVVVIVETGITPYAAKNQGVVGVDVGIKQLAVLSDGTTFKTPTGLKKNAKQLKRLQRQLAKKQKGSNNRKKAVDKLARLHYRIRNQRSWATHNLTSWIVSNYQTVVIEDLNVSGMLKNHNLARSLSNSNFGEIRRQLEYKCELNSRTLVVADRFYPSSKACSCCGCVKEKLSLGTRVYDCEHCGLSLDRDLNAAINLKNLVPESLGELKPVEPCSLGAETGISQ